MPFVPRFAKFRQLNGKGKKALPSLNQEVIFFFLIVSESGVGIVDFR